MRAAGDALLEFMEREVPPEIRRYVTDADKIKAASSELTALWARQALTNIPATDADDDATRQANLAARQAQLVSACFSLTLLFVLTIIMRIAEVSLAYGAAMVCVIPPMFSSRS